MTHTETIKQTTVAGTPVTVTIEYSVKAIPLRPLYTVTRMPNGADFVNYLSCGRSDEASAEEAAAFLTSDTETRRGPLPVGIGDRLANGATVLQVAPANLHRGGTAFLALFHDEFVTWIGREDGTDTTWGHYFGGALDEAFADFQVRSGESNARAELAARKACAEGLHGFCNLNHGRQA